MKVKKLANITGSLKLNYKNTLIIYPSAAAKSSSLVRILKKKFRYSKYSRIKIQYDIYCSPYIGYFFNKKGRMLILLL